MSCRPMASRSNSARTRTNRPSKPNFAPGRHGMSGRLQDKVTIVVGAGCVGPGWGNGRAVAVRFAQEGARIFAVDKNADAMAETLERIRAEGGDVTSWTCD